MSRTIAPSGSQARLILIGTALLLTLGMGMRQSFGLFLAPVTHDLAVTAADFTLALAVQNIVWGLSQALVGSIADRFGLRITMMAGAAIYVVGLGIMASAQGALALIISGGLIGVALSCTATSLAMAACVRAVSEERRSMTLGLVAAAGSLGTLVVPLATQALLAREPWQIGALFFVLMAVAMLPAAFLAGGADRIPAPQHGNDLHARGARPGHAEPAVSCDVGRLFRLWSQSRISEHAFAGLSGALRPGSHAGRRSACRDRRRERPRLIADRLARREISEAHTPGSPLHPTFDHDRHLFRAAAHSDKHAPVRCGDGHAVVARPGAAYRRVWSPKSSALAISRPCSASPSSCTRPGRRLEPGAAG